MDNMDNFVELLNVKTKLQSPLKNVWLIHPMMSYFFVKFKLCIGTFKLVVVSRSRGVSGGQHQDIPLLTGNVQV